jgi:hypothetical protein
MMTYHLYEIGQTVRFSNRFGSPQTTDPIFRITGKLPAVGRSLQYRIRCDDERHDRVATEETLSPVQAFFRSQTVEARESVLGA